MRYLQRKCNLFITMYHYCITCWLTHEKKLYTKLIIECMQNNKVLDQAYALSLLINK